MPGNRPCDVQVSSLVLAGPAEEHTPAGVLLSHRTTRHGSPPLSCVYALRELEVCRVLNLCRVYCFGHSANKVFAECPTKNTRQIIFLPSVLFLALGKDKYLPSVFFYTRQRFLCRVYYFWHLAKIMIRRVFFFTLGKELNFSHFQPQKFFHSPHTTCVSQY